MSLYAKRQQRAAAGRPVRIGLIGAGKSDVAIDTTTPAYRIRKAMEHMFTPAPAAGSST